MRLNSAFVDTSAWFDFFIPGQDRTTAMRKAITGYKGKLLTSDFVVDELMTLIKVRKQLGKHALIWSVLSDSSWVEVLRTSAGEMKAAYEIFARYSDKNWSFTDCLSFHFIRAGKISHAFSTDRHFHEFGIVSVLP